MKGARTTENCYLWMPRESSYVLPECCEVGKVDNQLVLMKKMLTKPNVTQGVMGLFCDNSSGVGMINYPIQHSKSKHIDFCHYRVDSVEDEDQLTKIFTRIMKANQFKSLRGKLGICSYQNL